MKDDYDRSSKKYWAYKWSDVNTGREFPGNKEVYRIYNKDNKIIADLITLYDEKISEDEDLEIFDPVNTWKRKTLKKGEFKIKKMLEPIIVDGKLVYEKKTVEYSKNKFKQELDTLYEDNKRLTNPKELYVDLSQKLYDTKIRLLNEKG